jgi:hypothetical protein
MSRLLLVFLIVATAVASAAGQEAKYRAPRTESGRPDLQGVWNFNTGVPLQRPAALSDKKVLTKEEFAARRAAMLAVLKSIGKIAPVEDVGLDWMDGTLHVDDLRTSLITFPENGRLPATLEGVRKMPQIDDFIALLADGKGPPPAALGALLAMFTGGKKDSYTDFMMSERCLFDAPVPLVPQLDDNYVQIVQSPDHLVLITDFNRRIITLDGKPPVGNAIRSWPGISRGHWEGETLVVETRNFNEKPPSFAGAGNSADKVVTERFTRTGSNRIDVSATIVDAKTFKDRIELSFPMALVDARIYEGACHEGNYSMRNALSASRKADAEKK